MCRTKLLVNGLRSDHTRAMTSRRGRIGVAIVAALVIVIIVGAIGYLSLQRQGTTLMTTEQNDFTLKGPTPLVTVTPQNNTFTLSYNATTLSSPVSSLSFSLNQSWVMIFTNGTEWVPYSQACSSILDSSSSEESVPAKRVTRSRLPRSQVHAIIHRHRDGFQSMAPLSRSTGRLQNSTRARWSCRSPRPLLRPIRP
jgi:hypothetical protein